MSARSYIVDDREKKTFLLDREVLVSEDVLRQEMAHIFGRCWIYVGHSSELRKPGDFRSRKVGGRPVIFCRDQAGAFHCLFNTCRHRGAMVCTERAGNRRRFQCIYHGWTYGNDGRLVGVPGADAYAESFDKSAYGLRRPARFEEYRGFWFMCLNADIDPLSDYLAGARDYIDLVIDQSPSGQMEIIAGVQEYDVAANWKLMVENSVDDYHLPSTHSTWLNFMANSGVKIEPAKEEGLVLPTPRQGGRARQRPLHYRQREFPRPAGGEVDPALRRAGQGRDRRDPRRAGQPAGRRARAPRRRYQPQPGDLPQSGDQRRLLGHRAHVLSGGAGKMHVTAWALGPVEEVESARARRLDAFLTFYGPGGFATPDDVEALELVQQGLANWAEDRWSEMSRGVGKEGEQLNSDEHHLRIFWRRWNELMGAAQ